ncbi:MAG TPA: hypothetical protein VGK21_15195 [Candidatus Angelobacter sp.]
MRGDSSGDNVTKPATLETGLEIRVPLSSNKVRASRCPQRRGSLWPGRESITGRDRVIKLSGHRVIEKTKSSTTRSECFFSSRNRLYRCTRPIRERRYDRHAFLCSRFGNRESTFLRSIFTRQTSDRYIKSIQ